MPALGASALLFLAVCFAGRGAPPAVAESSRPAAGLRDLVGAAEWQALAARGELSRPLQAGQALSLVPAVPAAASVRRELEGLSPTVGVEILLLIDTPRAGLHSPKGMLTLYNALRSVSSMKGLQYYSATWKRARTLFEESYAIDSPESRRPLADPLVGEIPAEDRITIYQKDLSFGENVHRVEYRCDGQSIFMAMRNLEPITYLKVPLVQPLGFRSVLLVIPRDRQVLVYGLSCSRMARLFGLERRKEESLYNRMKAMAGWFAGRLSL